MSNIITTAPCRFCGRVVQISEEYQTMGQEEEAAAMACDCPKARVYQKQKKREERIMKNISNLFGEGAPPEKRAAEEIVDMLHGAVGHIMNGRIERLTVSLMGGVKATLSQNSKGEINVERSETKKQKLTQ